MSRQSTTRDLGKLFNERRDILKKSVLPAASSVALTSDICLVMQKRTTFLLLLTM